MCKCLDGKSDIEKTSANSILVHVHDSLEEKDNDKDYIIKGEVYWEDFEREQLVKMLLEPGEENVSVIPIIGNGGVGKTSLAHYVYSDERVEEYFHLREWVCASDTFDMMRVAGDLEESLYLSGHLDEVQLLDLYDKNLITELKGKRILLVLDDVRSPEWVPCFRGLETDVKGSKILSTSQEETVIDEQSERNKIVLNGIRGEEFWDLFKKSSFGDEDHNKYPDLEIIGGGIAGKLEPFPLAAKMVGGALREKLDSHHWMNILRSELLELGKACGNVMPYLRLSYQHLPIHLQRCFAYCSVFPKGYAFEIDKLVHIWIAQGVLIQPSRVECIQCYGGQDLGGTGNVVRHLSFSLWAGLNSEFEWKNIRTLVINTNHVMELELLKRVRVLDLSHSYMRELPDSIGCLIHLRYLNLSGNYLCSLPESLCKLYHLQTLIVPHICQIAERDRKPDKLALCKRGRSFMDSWDWDVPSRVEGIQC